MHFVKFSWGASAPDKIPEESAEEIPEEID
jgi:hypothetical protein